MDIFYITFDGIISLCENEKGTYLFQLYTSWKEMTLHQCSNDMPVLSTALDR